MAGRDFFKRLGPGIVTGAADDDPSGIGTYSQAGAAAGYGFLWSALWLLPLAFAVQETCARLALVTGKGLAALIKSRMPRWVLVVAVVLVAVANTVNIAADLAIMSSALGLIAPVEQWAGVVMFAVLLAATEIAIPYHRYARVLRWLTISLLAYVAVLFVAEVDWGQVATSTLLPQFDFTRVSFELLIALAGTTISPYLFFWQAAEEIEERKHIQTRRVRLSNLQAMRGDVFTGMFTGVFIMFAIMATSAATLNAQGITDIATAADAALALKPIAGEFAGLLFLLGILGVGLLSIPVLAGSTAYAVAETFGWRESLELKPRQAKAFYAVIVVSMFVALALNLIGIEPVKFLILAAVLNGLAAPVLMAIVWWLARDKNLLGKWASPIWSKLLLGMATVAMGSLPLFWLLAK
ncbi:NRAMP family divalent metal transporter [Rhodoluna lacicola]|uniref:Mn2+ and Fe2+ transporters of the NRAMP family n=1 Tax=Rhodoluna lacicola TaxID=529884 RepID=A0A060JPF0_9MICO|nr:divalent metal cation transporter [Rhodoluna lacicola]AIC48059.1 Mn2+ and Fe2+ transporters of the NRAMP family [Rhodoluna lacicola]